MIRATFLILSAAFFLAGCGNRTHANMQAAIADTIKNEPYVSDFDRLYTNADHFITYYTESYGDPIWNSKVLIDNHIELTMQFDINIDMSGKRVTRTSEPRFFIITNERVTNRPNGSTLIEHGPGMDFGPDEWDEIVKANGDLSVIFSPE